MSKLVGSLGVYLIFTLIMVFSSMINSNIKNPNMLYSLYYSFIFSMPLIILILTPCSLLADFISKKRNISRVKTSLSLHIATGLSLFILFSLYLSTKNLLDLYAFLLLLIYFFAGSIIFWIFELEFLKYKTRITNLN